ncbi:MAG: hypothetical protein O7G32_00255 [SAR324 cluster bacterium]|nr:hypothetical protein [SAR324 cluster bacterium]
MKLPKTHDEIDGANKANLTRTHRIPGVLFGIPAGCYSAGAATGLPSYEDDRVRVMEGKCGTDAYVQIHAVYFPD